MLSTKTMMKNSLPQQIYQTKTAMRIFPYRISEKNSENYYFAANKEGRDESTSYITDESAGTTR